MTDVDASLQNKSAIHKSACIALATPLANASLGRPRATYVHNLSSRTGSFRIAHQELRVLHTAYPHEVCFQQT